MSTTDLIAILSLVTVVATVLMLAACHYKWAHPKKWHLKGAPPPPGFDEAMDVIAMFTPGMKQGGYIEWVTGPFFLKGQRVAGALMGTNPFRIKLMYVYEIEKSALAHEMEHAYQITTSGITLEPSESPGMAMAIATINAAIAKELGR
jgi:hypothetical protein